MNDLGLVIISFEKLIWLWKGLIVRFLILMVKFVCFFNVFVRIGGRKKIYVEIMMVMKMIRKMISFIMVFFWWVWRK